MSAACALMKADVVSLHATAIAIGGDGVLLRGPGGAGKSDLALRLIDKGAVLIADDVVDLTATADGPIARAPGRLAGLLEIRGLGPMRVDAHVAAPIRLIAELGPAAAIARVPHPETADLLGVRLPLIRIDPTAASATARLRFALRQLANFGRLHPVTSLIDGAA